MINKVEFKDLNSLISIDLINNGIEIYRVGNLVYKKEILFDVSELESLIRKFTTYWDSEYINNTIIDGINSKLTIYIENEIITYSFKNEFPYNYNDFVYEFKKLVGVIGEV